MLHTSRMCTSKNCARAAPFLLLRPQECFPSNDFIFFTKPEFGIEISSNVEYCTGPVGCSDLGQVSVGPVGCSDLGQVSAGPVGCSDLGQVSAGPDGCSDLGQVSAGPVGCSDLGQVSAGPVGSSDLGQVSEKSILYLYVFSC